MTRTFAIVMVCACSSKDAAPPPPPPAQAAPLADAAAPRGATLQSLDVTAVGDRWSATATWDVGRPARFIGDKVAARCAVGDRVYTDVAHVVGRDGIAKIFSEPLPARPERCELRLYKMHVGSDALSVACWTPTGITAGPCTAMPKPLPPHGPVAIEDLQVELSPSRVLRATWTIVAAAASNSNMIRPTVECQVGDRVYSSPPRSFAFIDSGLGPGDRRLVTRYAFSDAEPTADPDRCRIVLYFERHEFDHEPIEVATACWTRAGTTPGPCATWPAVAPGKRPVEVSHLAIVRATHADELDLELPKRTAPRERYAVEADVKVGEPAGIPNGLSAHVRYRDGSAWRVVEGKLTGALWDVAPGDTRRIAIDLPYELAASPPLVELALALSKDGVVTELATYCLVAGVARPGRCP